MIFKLQQRYIHTSISLLLMQVCMFGHAEESIDMQNIYEESKQVAKGLEPKLQELVKGGGGAVEVQEALQSNEEARHKAEELGNLAILGEKAKETDIEEKCTRSKCNLASVMSTKAMNKREAKLEEYGFRKDKEQFPEDDKGYVDKVRHSAKKFESSFDAISGSYKDCKSKDQSYSYKETEECDEYYDVKYSNCPVVQVVEIDPKYTYECNKKREESLKTCHDEITSITCRKSSECDAVGIENVKGRNVDWNVASGKLVLTFESQRTPEVKRKNKSNCRFYDYQITFDLEDKERMKEFKVDQTDEDDHLQIKINGQIVFTAPSPAFSSYFITRPDGRWSCEMGRTSHQNPNLDLLPYLVKGINTIDVIHAVSRAGGGSVKMQVRAEKKCCKDEDWVIQRETTCKHEGM